MSGIMDHRVDLGKRKAELVAEKTQLTSVLDRFTPREASLGNDNKLAALLWSRIHDMNVSGRQFETQHELLYSEEDEAVVYSEFDSGEWRSLSHPDLVRQEAKWIRSLETIQITLDGVQEMLDRVKEDYLLILTENVSEVGALTCWFFKATLMFTLRFFLLE